VGAALALAAARVGRAAVLLHDDFNGPALSSVWAQGTWLLGRTRLGAPISFSNDAGISFVTLTLHTYNPLQPGTYLYSSELYSTQDFARGAGLLVEARVRQRTETRGLVSSLFGYRYLSNVADEIDFEFLTTHATNEILVTQWNDWDYSGANGSQYQDGIHHYSVMITNSAVNRRVWTVLRYYWMPGETIWEANGVELYRSAAARPDSPMPARANFWAPNSDWGDAYATTLQPTAQPAQDQVWHYDIDYITVAAIPEAAPLWCALAGWLTWPARRAAWRTADAT
jgi:hypothetical protein